MRQFTWILFFPFSNTYSNWEERSQKDKDTEPKSLRSTDVAKIISNNQCLGHTSCLSSTCDSHVAEPLAFDFTTHVYRLEQPHRPHCPCSGTSSSSLACCLIFPMTHCQYKYLSIYMLTSYQQYCTFHYDFNVYIRREFHKNEKICIFLKTKNTPAEQCWSPGCQLVQSE